MPTVYQENHDYFHTAYESKKYPWSSGQCIVVEKFLEEIDAGKRGNVNSLLDLGCGEGANVRMAARKGFYAVGLDREPLAVEAAGKLALKEGLERKTNFLVSDSLTLPFESNSFDIVLDHGCFHHLRKGDWQTYRKNLERILKPGGHFILEVFSKEHKGYGKIPERGWHFKQGAYRRFFDQKDIQTFLGNKFEILNIEEKKGEIAGDWHVLTRKNS